MNLNKVMLAGRLTKDPEVKTLPSGSKIITFTLAVNRTWIDKNTGEKVEKAEFINCVLFGNENNTFEKWNKKGDAIYVDGRIQNRSWEDEKTGVKRYATDIIVEKWDFVQKAGQGTGSSKAYEQYDESNQTEKHYSKGAKPVQEEELPIIQADEEEINIEDIPF